VSSLREVLKLLAGNEAKPQQRRMAKYCLLLLDDLPVIPSAMGFFNLDLKLLVTVFTGR